eukprot:3560187-Alexandrium_andersonii.AAC.1
MWSKQTAPNANECAGALKGCTSRSVTGSEHGVMESAPVASESRPGKGLFRTFRVLGLQPPS